MANARPRIGAQRADGLLFFAFARPIIFRGGFESLLEADHIFARTEVVECLGLALEFFLGIIGGLD